MPLWECSGCAGDVFRTINYPPAAEPAPDARDPRADPHNPGGPRDPRRPRDPRDLRDPGTPDSPPATPATPGEPGEPGQPRAPHARNQRPLRRQPKSDNRNDQKKKKSWKLSPYGDQPEDGVNKRAVKRAMVDREWFNMQFEQYMPPPRGPTVPAEKVAKSLQKKARRMKKYAKAAKPYTKEVPGQVLANVSWRETPLEDRGWGCGCTARPCICHAGPVHAPTAVLKGDTTTGLWRRLRAQLEERYRMHGMHGQLSPVAGVDGPCYGLDACLHKFMSPGALRTDERRPDPDDLPGTCGRICERTCQLDYLEDRKTEELNEDATVQQQQDAVAYDDDECIIEEETVEEKRERELREEQERADKEKSAAAGMGAGEGDQAEQTSDEDAEQEARERPRRHDPRKPRWRRRRDVCACQPHETPEAVWLRLECERFVAPPITSVDSHPKDIDRSLRRKALIKKKFWRHAQVYVNEVRGEVLASFAWTGAPARDVSCGCPGAGCTCQLRMLQPPQSVPYGGENKFASPSSNAKLWRRLQAKLEVEYQVTAEITKDPLKPNMKQVGVCAGLNLCLHKFRDVSMPEEKPEESKLTKLKKMFEDKVEDEGPPPSSLCQPECRAKCEDYHAQLALRRKNATAEVKARRAAERETTASELAGAMRAEAVAEAAAAARAAALARAQGAAQAQERADHAAEDKRRALAECEEEEVEEEELSDEDRICCRPKETQPPAAAEEQTYSVSIEEFRHKERDYSWDDETETDEEERMDERRQEYAARMRRLQAMLQRAPPPRPAAPAAAAACNCRGINQIQIHQPTVRFANQSMLEHLADPMVELAADAAAPTEARRAAARAAARRRRVTLVNTVTMPRAPLWAMPVHVVQPVALDHHPAEEAAPAGASAALRERMYWFFRDRQTVSTQTGVDTRGARWLRPRPWARAGAAAATRGSVPTSLVQKLIAETENRYSELKQDILKRIFDVKDKYVSQGAQYESIDLLERSTYSSTSTQLRVVIDESKNTYDQGLRSETKPAAASKTPTAPANAVAPVAAAAPATAKGPAPAAGPVTAKAPATAADPRTTNAPTTRPADTRDPATPLVASGAKPVLRNVKYGETVPEAVERPPPPPYFGCSKIPGGPPCLWQRRSTGGSDCTTCRVDPKPQSLNNKDISRPPCVCVPTCKVKDWNVTERSVTGFEEPTEDDGLDERQRRLKVHRENGRYADAASIHNIPVKKWQPKPMSTVLGVFDFMRRLVTHEFETPPPPQCYIKTKIEGGKKCRACGYPPPCLCRTTIDGDVVGWSCKKKDVAKKEEAPPPPPPPPLPTPPAPPNAATRWEPPPCPEKPASPLEGPCKCVNKDGVSDMKCLTCSVPAVDDDDFEIDLLAGRPKCICHPMCKTTHKRNKDPRPKKSESESESKMQLGASSTAKPSLKAMKEQRQRFERRYLGFFPRTTRRVKYFLRNDFETPPAPCCFHRMKYEGGKKCSACGQLLPCECGCKKKKAPLCKRKKKDFLTDISGTIIVPPSLITSEEQLKGFESPVPPDQTEFEEIVKEKTCKKPRRKKAPPPPPEPLLPPAPKQPKVQPACAWREKDPGNTKCKPCAPYTAPEEAKEEDVTIKAICRPKSYDHDKQQPNVNEKNTNKMTVGQTTQGYNVYISSKNKELTQYDTSNVTTGIQKDEGNGKTGLNVDADTETVKLVSIREGFRGRYVPETNLNIDADIESVKMVSAISSIRSNVQKSTKYENTNPSHNACYLPIHKGKLTSNSFTKPPSQLETTRCIKRSLENANGRTTTDAPNIRQGETRDQPFIGTGTKNGREKQELTATLQEDTSSESSSCADTSDTSDSESDAACSSSMAPRPGMHTFLTSARRL